MPSLVSSTADGPTGRAHGALVSTDSIQLPRRSGRETSPRTRRWQGGCCAADDTYAVAGGACAYAGRCAKAARHVSALPSALVTSAWASRAEGVPGCRLRGWECAQVLRDASGAGGGGCNAHSSFDNNTVMYCLGGTRSTLAARQVGLPYLSQCVCGTRAASSSQCQGDHTYPTRPGTPQ